MEWRDLVKSQPRDIRRLLEMEGQKGRYARIEIPLGTASTDGLLEIMGDYIGVVSITGDGTCKMRLDHRHAQQIDLREVEEIMSPFGKVYFTTDGAGGTLTIYVGGALTARLKPIQSKVSLRSVAGTDIDPAQDKRFKAHVSGHLKVAVATADTAKRVITASTKVKWAIISVEDYDARWGFSSTVHRANAIGQKVAKGSFVTVEYCDLADIWFVNFNAGAGELPIFQIEYLLET